MAFEPGGRAEKLGNRYEGRWVVSKLLQLVYEDIRSVEIECIGDDERGVDLWITRNDGVRQAQQCKARNASQESWSVSDLKRRGVLEYAKYQLDRDRNHEFALVSGVPATQIGDICESARSSNGRPEDFYEHQIVKIGSTRRTVFCNFCKALRLNADTPADRGDVFDYLRRSYVHAFSDDQHTRETMRTWAGMLFTGEPDVVIASLADYAEGVLGQVIHADDVRGHMASLGFHPVQLAKDNRIAPAIQQRQLEFTEWLQPKLIRGQLIPREETRQIRDALNANSLVVVHGAAGVGKSGVLFELTQRLAQEGVPFLPITLDQTCPKNTPREFGEDLGLPGSPVLCIDGLAGSRQSVLIVDQLDALRWTAIHSNNALMVCKALTREVYNLRSRGKQISIIFSCRSFDLDHDLVLRSWLGSHSEIRCQRIEVNGLSEQTVNSIVGLVYSNMSSQQKEVLAFPHNLAMWTQLATPQSSPNFQTATDLMRAYWDDRRRALRLANVPDNDVQATLDTLVDHLDRERHKSVPERVFVRYARTCEALHSLGVLFTSSHCISFTHQSYLDFLIADRLLKQVYDGTGSISGWLGGKSNQSLFRREQLRYMLSLLCEESFEHFLKEIRDILASPSVRFHLKHLVLEVLSQIKQPSAAVIDYLLELLGDESWKPHVTETILFGRKQFIKALADRHILHEWLKSERHELRNTAMWLLRSVNEECGDLIVTVLDPYVPQGEEWRKSILWMLPIRAVEDSNKLFELRLQLVRLGHTDGFVDWPSLARTFPKRAIQLIEAVISTFETSQEDNDSSSSRSCLENWLPDDIKALTEAVSQYPEYTWDTFMPHIARLIPLPTKHTFHRSYSWEDAESGILEGPRRNILSGVIQLLRTAGKILAAEKADLILEKSCPYENSSSPAVQHILVNVYASLPPSHADKGINWLLADKRRFALG